MKKLLFVAAAAASLAGCAQMNAGESLQTAGNEQAKTPEAVTATTAAGAFAEQILPRLKNQVKIDVLQPRPVKAEDVKGVGYRLTPDEKTYRYILLPVRFSYQPDFLKALEGSLTKLEGINKAAKPEDALPFGVNFFTCRSEYCGVADMLDTAKPGRTFTLDDSRREAGKFFDPKLLKPEVHFTFSDKDGNPVVEDVVMGYFGDGERVHLPLPVNGYVARGEGGRLGALPLILNLGKTRSLNVYEKSEMNFLVALKPDEVKRIARIAVNVK